MAVEFQEFRTNWLKSYSAEEEFGERPRPRDEWQKRYGWPTGRADRAKEDDRVLDWMKKVTLKMWGLRYGNACRNEMVKKACEARRKRRQEREENDDKVEVEEWMESWQAQAEEDEDSKGESDDEESDISEKDR